MLFPFMNLSVCMFGHKKKIYKVTNLKVHSKGRYFFLFFLALFKNYIERLVWTTALFSGCCDITKQLIRISLKHIFEQIIFLFETKITCYSQYSAHKCSFRSQYSLVKLFKFKKEKNWKKHNRMNTTQQNETAFKILSIINYTM